MRASCLVLIVWAASMRPLCGAEIAPWPEPDPGLLEKRIPIRATAPWADGLPATSVPAGDLGPIELAVPEGRPAAALALLFLVSGFHRVPDFELDTLVVETRSGDAAWRTRTLAWQSDESSRRRRSAALGVGEALIWAPLRASPAESLRISGFPRRSQLRLAEVLLLHAAPAESTAASPRGGVPPFPGAAEHAMGVPRQAELSAERIEAIAACRGDLLAAEMPARGEPSFEELARLAYSFPGTASLGLPFAREEAGILWNGTIVVPGRAADGTRLPRLFVPLIGKGLVPWGIETEVRRRLVAGESLRTEAVTRWENGAVYETACVAPGGEPNGNLHLRFRVESRSDAPLDCVFALAAVIRDSGPYPWEGIADRADLRAERPRFDEATGVVSVGSRAMCRAKGPLALLANGEETLLVCERTLEPREQVLFEFVVPLGETRPEALADASDFEAALARSNELWSGIFGRAAGLDLPESRLRDLYRASIAQLLIAADGDIIPYGAFPSVYDAEVLGVEEIWEMEALASFGFAQEAVRLLRGTYFTPAHLNKRTKHHQYRNGLTAQVAWRIYELTRDRDLLAEAPGILLPLAEWTRGARRGSGDGAEPAAPLHAGLLPKHLYGGDLEEPCHALYGNFACWRGLRDTALLLAEAGRARESEDLRREASAYRDRITKVCEAIAKRGADPPFLPFRLEETAAAPASGDYYQLFGPLVLETGCLARGGALQGLVIDAIEKSPRLIARQARFGEPLGLDAHYTRGLMAEWLRAGRRSDFLMGFYGQQAFACDRDVLTCPEVMPLFFTSAHRRDEELRRLTGARRTDPCAAGPATFLLCLRDMLVLEERDADDLPTGRLIIGAGIPRAWMRPGAVIEAGPIATAYGAVELSATLGAPGEKHGIVIETKDDRRPRLIVLRFPDRPERVIQVAGPRTAAEF